VVDFIGAFAHFKVLSKAVEIRLFFARREPLFVVILNVVKDPFFWVSGVEKQISPFPPVTAK
jgi:hypothetical protein